MNANRLLVSPAFVIKGNLISLDEVDAVASAAFGEKKSKLLYPDAAVRAVSSSMEYYIRWMLTSCAFGISFPAYTGSAWAKPRRLKSILTPSLRVRTTFLDKDGKIWSAVDRYFEPMRADFLRYSASLPFGRPERLFFRLIWTAWDVYKLILATRNHCETDIDPYWRTSNINVLLSSRYEWSRESQARWAVLATLFRNYSINEEIPSLFCLSMDPQLFSERVDEILEDAYLLEASTLRKLFGLRENITAIRRDLRKLLKFIVGKRSWAKGLLGLGSQGLSLAQSSGAVLDEIGKIVDLMNMRSYAPFLSSPEVTHVPLSTKGQFVTEAIRNVVDRNWAAQTLGGNSVDSDEFF